MLMEVKNQIKVMVLSVKYNIMKQMTNKVTFITNIVFMILNNASFIVQWIILFNLKNEIGGYTIREVVLLWGIAASTYGIAHIVFCKAFDIPELIINGKLDTFLVQPKNVFLGVLTSDTKISAIGDLIYGYICLAIYGITIKNFILFTIFLDSRIKTSHINPHSADLFICLISEICHNSTSSHNILCRILGI